MCHLSEPMTYSLSCKFAPKTFLFPSVPVVFQVFSPRTPQRYSYSWCVPGLDLGGRSCRDKLVFEVNLSYVDLYIFHVDLNAFGSWSG